VFGVNELATQIRDARGSKPIIGVANSIAGSAAYLIGSAVDTLVVTPGGQVGSIGVYAEHQDISGAADQAGVKVTTISAGKFKTEGNEFEPLTDSARENMQEMVDSYYDQFVSAVAKGRGVSASVVRSKFGQGRMLMADDALTAGMVDRVASFDQVMGELGRAAKAKNRNRLSVM
jgi:signal peptide peptidase SppA